MAAEGSHAAAASSSAAPATAKKDRHVVTWTPQEDDLLREQIALHGTNNWTSISAKFKDKTSRQCRRRWFTYLNTECKKGGWSAEEDMLLCEAQKILGNKWTEIAKVVAGRTDNAVKNRFTTLCKKRAKDEALYKENNVPCASTDTDRYLFTRDRLISAGVDVSSLPAKKIRYDLSDPGQRIETTDSVFIHQVTERGQLRQPLAEVSQNAGNSKKPSTNVSGTVGRRKFLAEGDSDSKLAALLKQAELLSSLAVKVNSENSKESLDEARKELQEYMKQMEKTTAEGGMSDTIFLLDDLKDLIEDLRNSTEQNLQTRLQLQELPDKASNSKSLLDAQIDASRSVVDASIECFTFADGLIVSPSKEDPVSTIEEVCAEVSIHFPEKAESKDGSDSARKDLADSKYDSPMQKFPAFQSVADAIPSPKFSESERKFLFSLLELSSPGSNIGCPRDPSCKRALLGSL